MITSNKAPKLGFEVWPSAPPSPQCVLIKLGTETLHFNGASVESVASRLESLANVLRKRSKVKEVSHG